MVENLHKGEAASIWRARRRMQLHLIYTASALTALWGVAHLFATRGVVAGFGSLSEDNRRILTMEWINEGATLIVLGALVGAVTFLGAGGSVALAVYLISAAALLAFATISLFTGFKVAFLPFKLCPVIFSASAVLIICGSVMR